MTEAVLSNLKQWANVGDDINLIDVALAFDALDHEGISTQRYTSHTKKIRTLVQARHQQFLNAGSPNDAATAIASLHDVISLQLGYKERPQEENNPKPTSLIMTIDERCGTPGFMTLLAIDASEAMGWTVHGLNIPGRFLARIALNAERIVFDPADGFKILQAHDIRDIVKQECGAEAEISNSYFDAIPKRSIIMFLQNQSKLLKVRLEDYPGALSTVRAMQAFEPSEYRLYLDAGILYAKTGQPEVAIFALEHYIAKTPDERSRQEALRLINDLRGMN